MSERSEETVVKVEKRSGSDVKASVTKDGQSGKGTGTATADNIDQAVAQAAEKAKSQTKATGGR